MIEELAPVSKDATAALVGGITATQTVAFAGLISSSARAYASLLRDSGVLVGTIDVVVGVWSGGAVTASLGTSSGKTVSALGTSASPAMPTGLELADVKVDREAEAYFKQHESLVREAITLLKSAARRHGIRSAGIILSYFSDPDEGDSQLVVTQILNVETDAALSYWDDVGRDIQNLAATLDPENALVLSQRIAINVEWNESDTSVRSD